MKKLWIKILKVLLYLLQLFARKVLRMPLKAKEPDLGHDKKKVVSTKLRTLTVRPTGFDNIRFDPEKHPALPKLQQQAVHALFAKIGIEWIPGEFFDILKQFPLPTDAFEAFCGFLGIELEPIRHQNKDDLDLLNERIGVLLDLSTLRGDISIDVRKNILGQMKIGQHSIAAIIIKNIRQLREILLEATKVADEIVFPAYPLFIEAVRKYFTTADDLVLTTLKQGDVDSARTTQRGFREAQQQFDQLIGLLNDQISWMATSWPDNDWGKKNVKIRDGIVIEKERIETLLTNSADADIFTELENLDNLSRDLHVFIEEIRKNYEGGDFEEPVEESKLWQEFIWALEIFGLDEKTALSEKTIKKTYIGEAIKCHPDKFDGKPEYTAMETRFKDLGNARMILEYAIEHGRPKKPTGL